MNLSDIIVPDTAVCRSALQVVTAYSSPALVNHCVRSYLWSAAYAQARGIDFDAELLYVASVLHDIGLEKEFDSHLLPFEHAGGHVAWVFAAGAGWPAARRARTAEIVVAHMADPPAVADDPEGFLLELATAVDITGRDVEDWSDELIASVLAGYPRLDLASRFVGCVADQAARKPDSSAGGLFRSGIAERMKANPLESR